MGYLRYLLRRASYGLVVLFLTFTGSFFLLVVIPGDAAAALGSGGEGDVQATMDERRELLGLNRPILVQYADALGKAVRGDFGISFREQLPATEVYFGAFGDTLELALVGLAGAVVVGVGLGLITQLPRAGRLREVLHALPPLFVSFPIFLTALVLLQLFAFRWGVIEPFGDTSVLGLLIASLCIAFPAGAHVAQLLAVNLERTLRSPFVETLSNWGLTDREILFRHALKNAVLPVMTAFGTTVGYVFAGTVLTETVFSRNGAGRIIVDAVNAKDTPLVLLSVTVSAVIFVTVNLAIDALSPVLDRRIELT